MMQDWNAWGESWGTSWAFSWGPAQAVTTTSGGTGRKKRWWEEEQSLPLKDDSEDLVAVVAVLEMAGFLD